MNLNMTKYPNKEALRTAILDIYLDAMRDFIPRSLGKVRGTTSEELISIALECEPDDSKEAIDIPNIPYLIRKYWSDIFNREFTSKRLGGDAKRVAWNATELIVETRNYVVHPNTGEIDSEYTRACLSLIADVLDKINASEEKGQVETIRDFLFSDDTEERIAGMSKELEAAKADRDAYRENFKDVSDQLGVVKTERAELEEYLDTAEKEHSKQLKEVDADKAELEAHLAEVEAEKDDLKKRLKAIPDQSEVGKIERVADEERLQTALKQLKTANAVKTEVEERLETTSTRLEAVEVELTTCQEHLARTLRQLDEAKAEQTEYLSAEEHLARALTDERVVLPTGIEMEQPVLEFLADRKEYPRVEIIDLLTKHFSLTDDERKYLSKSGRAEKHLMNTDLIERTRIGYYRITVDGLEVLHQNAMDEDNVFSNEVYTESQSYSESPAQSPKSQRKWRHPGAVAALRDPTEIREVEAKIARILNPSEKSRLERELRAAKRAAFL